MAGKMQDRVLVLDVLRQGGGVAHGLLDEGRSRRVLRDQPFEVSLCAWTAGVVEQRDVPPVGDQSQGRVAAEETCAAGDEAAPLAGARRGSRGSCFRAR